jgi:hypothetical protein
MIEWYLGTCTVLSRSFIQCEHSSYVIAAYQLNNLKSLQLTENVLRCNNENRLMQMCGRWHDQYTGCDLLWNWDWREHHSKLEVGQTQKGLGKVHCEVLWSATAVDLHQSCKLVHVICGVHGTIVTILCNPTFFLCWPVYLSYTLLARNKM